MEIVNMVIIVVLILIIIWVIRKLFFTTNIIYDLMLDADLLANTTQDQTLQSFLITNKNVIQNKDIKENNNTNFMLSVWFYVDQWETTANNEKNILFMSTNANTTVPNEITGTFSGISKKVTKTDSTLYKNISIGLDNYENNLLVDIETLNNDSTPNANPYVYTRYIIKNIPIQKWNFVTLSVDGRTLDVYIDGKLRNSFIMNGIYRSKHNNLDKNIYLGNINVVSSGFKGWITRVRYEAEAGNPQMIYNMYREGINGSLASSMFNKYGLKVSFLEYGKEKGHFKI